jgi:uncharacterized protein with ParB-like and HNH nuclease domain
MTNDLDTLAKIFNKKLYRIPDYQRGYAWGESQLRDFWEDLVNLRLDKGHYTGLLTFKIHNSDLDPSEKLLTDNGYAKYDVVDGQQRLTTCIIFLNAIIAYAREINPKKNDDEISLGLDSVKDIVAQYICKKNPSGIIKSYLFGYSMDNPSQEYLKYRILEIEESDQYVEETFYTKNLKYADAFFRMNIHEYVENNPEKLSDLFRRLTTKLLFNINYISDDFDVYVSFETMNNRGKSLTNLEILKNRLIYLTTLFDSSKDDECQELRKKINDAWKEIYFQLGRNPEYSLSDDEFLRAHWIIFFKYTRKRGDDYIKFLLDYFSHRKIQQQTVVEEFQEGCPIEESWDNDEESEEDVTDVVPADAQGLTLQNINKYVESLKTLAGKWYEIHFPDKIDALSIERKNRLDRLNRIGCGYFKPLIMVAIMKNASNTDELLDCIERFIFIIFRLGAAQSTYASSYYYNKAHDLYNNVKDCSVDAIINDLKSDIAKKMELAIKNFVAKTEERFETEGFYKWNALRYFLYEYEMQLQNTKDGMLNKFRSWSTFVNDKAKKTISIEHVLPQTIPEDESNTYWKNRFGEYSEEQLRFLTGAIGNLLPLQTNINSALQNDSFDNKKSGVGKRTRGYRDGSNSEVEVAQNAEWTVKEIKERSVKLIDFLVARWGVVLTDEQKGNLIHLSFLGNSDSEE